MSTQALLEAMRRPEPITLEDIHEMIINHLLLEEDHHNGTQVGDVLLKLYFAVGEVGADDEPIDVPVESGPVAEQRMIRRYTSGHNQGMRLKKDPGYIMDSFSWPSGLTYSAERDYPIKVIDALGFALGYRDGKRAVAIARYFAQKETQQR